MDAIAKVPGVSEIANYVITFIKGQIGYISSYEENLEKLITEAQTLKDTQDGVQHRVVEAERNGDKIENIVQNWLKKANEMVAAANKVIDVEGTRWCLGHYCPYLWTRCQLSKSFEKITKEISDVIEKGKFDTISYRDAPDVTITPFSRGYEALESRTSMLNEIKEILKDPKMYMIGVHGMGGVGKTTLVNELAWQVKNDGSFGAVAIATITSSPNVEKVQDQIVVAICGKNLEHTTKVGRMGELRRRIKAQNNVLIILDDIWSELDLTEVGIPFGDEHNGCKLVITSREREVLIKMDTQKDFNLTALLEEDSWNLFQKIAGNVVNEVSIKPIAEEVAKCCAGLPLLITAVAKGLRKKEVHAWRVALKQLKEFKHKELENNELKSLFLFIGSFGENHILTEDLFRCCWGLGFYGGVDKLMEARDTHYTLINELRASSLLLEGELDWVGMHDVVRDVAKSIASKSPPTDPTYPTYADQFGKCHYIRFQSSLTEVQADNFFSRMMKEVMTLSLYEMSFTPFLPPSLNLLIKLRSLNLRRCKLGDIRLVAKISNLEILSLEESSIEELPEEITHLTHLRLLNLTDCYELRVIPTNLTSNLTCLEELYMGGCNSIEWEVEGSRSESKNASLSELHNLHNLTTLEISIKDTSVLSRGFQFPAKLETYNILIGNVSEWGRSQNWYGEALGPSRTLKLTGSWWTSISSLTTVEDLRLAELKGVKDLLYDLDVEGFPQLKHLHIYGSDELLHIINSRRLRNPHSSAFPNLKSLLLYNLYTMEEICHGPIPTLSFAKLEVIKVRNCHGLDNLLLYSLARNLSQLHEMKINNCRCMKEIIAMEEQEDEKELLEIVLPELRSLTLVELTRLQSFCLPLTVDMGDPSIQGIPLALFNQQVVTPKLKTLKLYDMDICKIWDDKLPLHSCFQNLTHLLVVRCDSLTSLFASWMGRGLVKLQYLNIFSCQMLKAIFFQECLDKLIVSSCHTLVNIIRPSTTTSLPNLRILRISECDELEEIYGSNNESDDAPLGEIAFRKLEELTLKYLPRLKSFCQGSYDFRFPSLQIVSLEECPVMDTFCQGNITTPSLTKVEYRLSRDNWYRIEDHWYGDLNTTVRTVFTKKYLYDDWETLDIRNNNNLKSIWPNQVTPNFFPNLTKIVIYRCESQYVFPIYVAKVLRQLQVLEIGLCTIENIVEESDSTCEMMVVYLEVRKCHDMMTIVPSSVQFHSLDELHVSRCHGLVNIIMPSTIANLPNLRILMISECDELEEVYGSNNESDEPLGEIAFMKLEELTLKYLPWLKSFCQGSYNFKFPSLQKVRCLYGWSNEESEDHWDGDLNTTIRTIFTKEVHINQTSEYKIRFEFIIRIRRQLNVSIIKTLSFRYLGMAIILCF
ncbi:putative disease resistance protein [Glycine soja]